jgi:phage baseplate assembly protein gpV
MPGGLIDKAAKDGDTKRPGFAIRTGVVIFNCDLLHQGKVLVRLPDLGTEVWARLSAPGAGSNTGLFHAPNADDEVLIALDQNDPSNCFLLGGLWSTKSSPPISKVPSSEMTKRVFRSGVTSAVGHQVEFDDALQSITITSSTQQKVAISPTAIEVSTTGGTVSIKLNLTDQSVKISAPLSISLEAQGEIKLSAAKVSINGTVQTDIKGGLVTIN